MSVTGNDAEDDKALTREANRGELVGGEEEEEEEEKEDETTAKPRDLKDSG